MAVHFAAGLYQHRKVSTVLALMLRCWIYFHAPNICGTFFFSKTTIVIYWFLQNFALSALRIACYFRYAVPWSVARPRCVTDALLVGRAADAGVLLRGIESGAVKRMWPVGLLSPSASDRGRQSRHSVLGAIDDLGDVVDDFSSRERPIERLVMLPSAFEADASPESVLTRARKLELVVSRLRRWKAVARPTSRACRGGRPSAAAERED